MDKIYVRFHVGRGGRFWNAGHITFVNEDNFQDLTRKCGDKLLINLLNDNEDPWSFEYLDESEWKLIDAASGRILVEGAAVCERTGILDWDGDYDKDIVTTTDELTQEQEDCLWEAYLADKYMSDELKDAICTLKDKKRAHDIRHYPSMLEVWVQDGGSVRIDIDRNNQEFTEDEWREMLDEQDFCPFSRNDIIDILYRYDVIKEED